MTERLKEFIESQKLSISAFEQRIGASDGMIRRAIKNGTDIQSKWLIRISENFHDLNIEWLITGKGLMYKQSKDLPVIETKKHIEETRPRIPMDAAAGSLSVASDGVTMEEMEQIPVIKAFSKYDFTIFARGDSMESELHSGDELACLLIRNLSFVQWGRMHVLDTSQGIIVKRIFDAGEYILCRSELSELYPEFKVHKSEIYNLALVIGMIRRY